MYRSLQNDVFSIPSQYTVMPSLNIAHFSTKFVFIPRGTVQEGNISNRQTRGNDISILFDISKNLFSYILIQ